jgi:MarR family transcriptional regulator, repressor for mepA
LDMHREDRIYEFYLRNIVHAIKELQDSKLIPYDITNQQARLLGDIDGQLKQEKKFCQKDLERTMNLRGSSITSLLQRLERKGFIVRSSGDEDGRTKQLQITEKGIKLIEEMEAVFLSVEDMLLKNMKKDEKEIYKRLLEISYQNFQMK